MGPGSQQERKATLKGLLQRHIGLYNFMFRSFGAASKRVALARHCHPFYLFSRYSVSKTPSSHDQWSICANPPIPPTPNSERSEISQLCRSVYHDVPLIKVIKDFVNMTTSSTQIEYMRNGGVNSKKSWRRRVNRSGVSYEKGTAFNRKD